MLRITPRQAADRHTLLLEGNLLKEWIEELQQALERLAQDGAAVALDLSGLRFVDAEGARYLRACRERGIALREASPFVSALLDQPPPRGRRSRP